MVMVEAEVEVASVGTSSEIAAGDGDTAEISRLRITGVGVTPEIAAIVLLSLIHI